MSINSGDKLFLLRDEPLERGYHALRHQVARVSSHTLEGVRIAVKSDCRWSNTDDLFVPHSDLEDGERFLWLRDQTIDGLPFTLSAPSCGGFYWFVGKTCLHSKVMLRVVRVVDHGPDKPLQFWYDGEMQFAGQEFSMEGLWAPQWRPSIPGVGR